MLYQATWLLSRCSNLRHECTTDQACEQSVARNNDALAEDLAIASIGFTITLEGSWVSRLGLGSGAIDLQNRRALVGPDSHMRALIW